jgi:hypothetical protein
MTRTGKMLSWPTVDHGKKNLEIDMGCGVGFGRGENQVVDKSIALPFVAAAHMAWYRTLASSRTEHLLKTRLSDYNCSQTYSIYGHVSSRVDLQRLATLSFTSIEVHHISDSLISAVRWRVDASRCMQRDNRRGRSNASKVTCRNHPNLPMWRRKLQSGGHRGGADPRLPSTGRCMTTRIPRP